MSQNHIHMIAVCNIKIASIKFINTSPYATFSYNNQHTCIVKIITSVCVYAVTRCLIYNKLDIIVKDKYCLHVKGLKFVEGKFVADNTEQNYKYHTV